MNSKPKVPRSDLRKLASLNRRVAKHLWAGRLSSTDLEKLVHLTKTLEVSVSRGEILYLDGNWYITHAGLLGIALRKGCMGIRCALQERHSDPASGRWVFTATVY